ncbi:MAG: catalase family peroxidase [Methylobacteriaceae bacterium]|nr:catalase family peroxidase [Methylobacteriaceae bacterium]
MIARKLFIGLAALAVASPDFAFAEDATVEVQVVDAMNKLFGAHAGFRAFHAKGIVVQGSFKASPEAASLSKAAIFDGSTIPVTVRFSDNGGFPTIPDGSADASPRGMAIKFQLPDGSEADMVTNSFKVFPVSTAAELRDLFLAAAASPPDAAKPTEIDKFVAAHPSVAAAASTLGTPDSFADEQYRGLNAFVFTNKAGEKQAVRYVIEPERVVHLDPADAQKRDPNFMIDELKQRLAAKKVTFTLKAQIAAPGDPTNDPSKPWPEDRKLVSLGVLTIDKAVANSEEAEKKLLYLPGQLPDGIEPSDDPMIDVRNGAYAVSFSRRNP